jgi:hypothetical protein
MASKSDRIEQQVVALYLAGEGKKPITETLGIKAYEMYAILAKHDVPLRPRGTRSASARMKWPEETIIEMCELAEELPITVILAHYPGLDNTTFWRYRKERGYKNKRNATAYWAGFVMAEGNLMVLSKGHSSLNLGVTATDEAHLKSFRAAVHSSHSIVAVPSKTAELNGKTIRSKPFRRLHLSGGDSLPTDLRAWGVVPRKSYCWVEPQIPDRLIRHFLRGWFDGDGTIDYRKNGQQYFKVTGNRQALEWYAGQLKRLGVAADPYFTKPHGRGPACDMRINGRWQVLHVASLLYREGDECLPRKWGVASHPDWRMRKQAPVLRRASHGAGR